jgi:Bacterial PH domain
VRLAEHDYEPVRGLPERLPDGERLLWQGSPQWRILAWRAFHLPLLATYFGVLIAARMAAKAIRGEPPVAVLFDGLWFLLPSIAVLGVVVLFAWGVARTSVYTITTRRIVMRFGIGLSVTANLPFARVDVAAARLASDRSGNISLGLAKGERVSWLFFWPHVRGWRFTRPEPTLLALADADEVARILGRALAGAADIPVSAALTLGPPDASPGAQPAPA